MNANSASTFTVAIVGRPNVGKSTLFNRLVGRRKAMVDDMPGVTRDRNYANVDRFDVPFILFVMDARDGLTPADREVVEMLRRVDKPVFHIVNKVDGERQETAIGEFY